MKRNIALFLLMIGMIICLSSCKTITGFQMNHLASEDYVINTIYDKDDFMIIGTANGESDFVYFDSATRKLVGDSHKYGFINGRLYGNIDKDFYAGTGREESAFNVPTDAFEAAKLNAVYALIEDAKTLGAHFIFEPNYTIETQPDSTGKTLMYKVKVTALAGRVFYY